MFCKYCGKPTNNAQVCVHCGREIAANIAPQTKYQEFINPKPTSSFIPFALILIICSVPILYFFYIAFRAESVFKGYVYANNPMSIIPIVYRIIGIMLMVILNVKGIFNHNHIRFRDAFFPSMLLIFNEGWIKLVVIVFGYKFGSESMFIFSNIESSYSVCGLPDLIYCMQICIFLIYKNRQIDISRKHYSLLICILILLSCFSFYTTPLIASRNMGRLFSSDIIYYTVKFAKLYAPVDFLNNVVIFFFAISTGTRNLMLRHQVLFFAVLIVSRVLVFLFATMVLDVEMFAVIVSGIISSSIAGIVLLSRGRNKAS